MRKLWAKLGLAAGFLGWDIWNVSAFLWSLRAPSVKVVGSMELHPLFFLLVACVTIPVTVAISGALFWEQIRDRLPRNRFHRLYGEIHEMAEKFVLCIDWENDSMNFDTELRERILALNYKLSNLKIRTPSLDEVSVSEWYRWLPRLAAWSKTKNLKGARAYKPGTLTVPRTGSASQLVT